MFAISKDGFWTFKDKTGLVFESESLELSDLLEDGGDEERQSVRLSL